MGFPLYLSVRILVPSGCIEFKNNNNIKVILYKRKCTFYDITKYIISEIYLITMTTLFVTIQFIKIFRCKLL